MSESEIFAGALEKRTPQERLSYLEACCGADSSLRKQVEELIQAHEGRPDFLGCGMLMNVVMLDPADGLVIEQARRA